MGEKVCGRTVDVVVDPGVNVVDLCPEGRWVKVDCGLLRGDEVVEFRVKHADDFGALVVHDGLQLLIKQHRDGEPVWSSVSRWIRISYSGRGNHAQLLTCRCSPGRSLNIRREEAQH